MSGPGTPYLRVTPRSPCPACGKPDWCRRSADGAVAICNRVPSDRPARGTGGGWVHRVAGGVPGVTVTGIPGSGAAAGRSGDAGATPRLSPAELVLADRRCRADLTPGRLAALAGHLRVSAASLRSLGAGWHHDLRAFTFPMRDADGRIVGLRTRLADGSKRCLAGSRLGLLEPDAGPPVDAGWLLVCEGESDAAAALDIGFHAVGRPGCEACRALVVARVAREPPGVAIAVIADADPPGQRGGHALAGAIAAVGLRVRVLTLPGAKDVRAFKARADGTHHALLALLDSPAAEVR